MAGLENFKNRSLRMVHADKPTKTVIDLKGRKKTDNRVSVCTDCRAGIFIQQEYIWTRRGLVHTECELKEDETKDAS
jgi:hypothetical protein